MYIYILKSTSFVIPPFSFKYSISQVSFLCKAAIFSAVLLNKATKHCNLKYTIRVRVLIKNMTI